MGKVVTLAVIHQVIGIADADVDKVESFLDGVQKLAEQVFPDGVRAIGQNDFYPVPDDEELARHGIDKDMPNFDSVIFSEAVIASKARWKEVCNKLSSEFYSFGDVNIADVEEMMERLGR